MNALEPQENESPVGHVYALVGLAAIVVAALFWLFTVNATAQRADANANQAIQKLDGKVDKDRFEQMENDVRDIKNCLLLKQCGGR